MKDHYFMGIAQGVSLQSKDPSTKVGAVAVRGGEILGTGFNRFPDGHPDGPAWYADRTYKYAHILHAEKVARSGLSLVDMLGATMYTNFPPCPRCAQELVDDGFSRFVFPPISRAGRDASWLEEWDQRFEEMLGIASDNDIQVSILHV